MEKCRQTFENKPEAVALVVSFACGVMLRFEQPVTARLNRIDARFCADRFRTNGKIFHRAQFIQNILFVHQMMYRTLEHSCDAWRILCIYAYLRLSNYRSTKITN